MRRVHWIDILTVLYVLFVVYGSMIPFDFAVGLPPTHAATFLKIPVVRSGLADTMSNVALYFPLGFLLRGYLRRREAPIVATVATLVAAAGISWCMEFAQTMLISRFASMADIVCNITGAGMGALVFATESSLARRFVPLLNREVARDPTAAVAGGACALVALAAWMPLDLTFDRSLIRRAVRRAHLVPFEQVRDLHERVNQTTGDFLPVSDGSAARLWDLRIDYAADVFLFFILGVLIVRHLRRRDGDSWLNSVQAALYTTGLAALITGAGLFVRSVGFDVTHILTRSFGGLVGVIVAHGLHVSSTASDIAEQSAGARRTQRAVLLAIGLSAAYIGVRELAPFRFDHDLAVTKLDRIEWLPMHSYALAKLPHAALDASHKLLRFLTFGALLAAWWLTCGMRVGARHYLLGGLTAAAGMVLFECAQCWLPGRVPALTDVLLAGAAAAGGVYVAALGHRWYQNAATPQVVTRQNVAILNVELPPPLDDAPTESIPTQHAKADVAAGAPKPRP